MIQAIGNLIGNEGSKVTIIGTVMLFTSLALVTVLRYGLSSWSNLSLRLRKSFILLVTGQISLLILIAYVSWPFSSFGLSQRNEIPDTFMSNLSSGNWETTFAMLTDVPEGEYMTIKSSFSEPANIPLKWELANPNSMDIAFGKAVFPDSTKLDIALFLEWEWEKARWGISGVEFGKDIGEGKIRFWLYDTFPPYSWFRRVVLILGIMCSIGSIAVAHRVKSVERYDFVST